MKSAYTLEEVARAIRAYADGLAKSGNLNDASHLRTLASNIELHGKAPVQEEVAEVLHAGQRYLASQVPADSPWNEVVTLLITTVRRLAAENSQLQAATGMARKRWVPQRG